MNKPALLVLAAGMGSRYGGLKQIDPVGPNGETIIDFSVYDAKRAGFGKLVFVIRKDIEAAFKESIGARFEKQLPVEYVYQELDRLPAGFTLPSGRKKPWGTGHAVMMARDVIKEPFAVINADDFYGARSYRLLAEHLTSGSPDYAMVGFVLKNTLSEFGSVARGLCRTNSEGYLTGVEELTKIEADGAGAKYTDAEGKVHPLTGDETVSMNIWGFNPGFFDHLQREFTEFLKQNIDSEKAEFYIPTPVNALVSSGKERLKVLRTPDSWFGVTYREDRPRVVESIRRLMDGRDYPAKLWA
jgi:NDP-sugar pyrophosphorylase family protein